MLNDLNFPPPSKGSEEDDEDPSIATHSQPTPHPPTLEYLLTLVSKVLRAQIPGLSNMKSTTNHCWKSSMAHVRGLKGKSNKLGPQYLRAQ
jgi:hypothetical protein